MLFNSHIRLKLLDWDPKFEPEVVHILFTVFPTSHFQWLLTNSFFVLSESQTSQKCQNILASQNPPLLCTLYLQEH